MPRDPSGPPAQEGPDIEFGSTNIFAVDPATAEATFVTTATASAPNWAFDASSDHVAWMDGFCAAADQDEVHTRIYDRRRGMLTELDQALWLKLTPGGEIGDGQFGPQALIDIETLEYTTVLPVGFSDVAWSPDYCYAAVGFPLGHGGLC